MSIDELRLRRHEILSLADRHGARNVRVFGSVARGDDRPESNIDLLIDIERGRSLLDVIGFEQELGQQRHGLGVSILAVAAGPHPRRELTLMRRRRRRLAAADA